MVRKTKEEALETRSQVLDAAERVFSVKGVTNTPLKEIAEAAGVSRGAIYWHFKNKYDLIGALLQRVKLPLDDMLAEQGADHADDPLELIRAKSITVLQRCVHDPHLRAVCTILFHKCERIEDAQPLIQRHVSSRAECTAELEANFRAAIAAGQLPSATEPKLATLGLFSYIDGLIYNWLLDTEQFDLDKTAAYFINSYLCGLQHQSQVG